MRPKIVLSEYTPVEPAQQQANLKKLAAGTGTMAAAAQRLLKRMKT